MTAEGFPRRRVWIAVLALAAVVAVAVAAVAVLRPTGEQRTVRVGLYENAPKIYTGPDGNPQGLFPDVLEDIAAREGWTLEWIDCAFAECLELLAQGDTAAQSWAAAHDAALRAALGKHHAGLQQALEAFDFDRALQLLQDTDQG